MVGQKNDQRHNAAIIICQAGGHLEHRSVAAQNTLIVRQVIPFRIALVEQHVRVTHQMAHEERAAHARHTLQPVVQIVDAFDARIIQAGVRRTLRNHLENIRADGVVGLEKRRILVIAAIRPQFRHADIHIAYHRLADQKQHQHGGDKRAAGNGNGVARRNQHRQRAPKPLEPVRRALGFFDIRPGKCGRSSPAPATPSNW